MSSSPNPAFARLTRDCKWPSGRAALWVGFVVGVVVLFLTSQSALRMKTLALGPLSTILLIAAWAVTLLTSPITAVVATILTSRDVHSGSHELVRLTMLPEAAMVQGYVFATLYRVRLLIALTIGLMPALAVGMFQVGLALSIIFSSYYSLQGIPAYPVEPLDAGMMEMSLVFTIMTIGLWGMNLLAAATGVGLALCLRGNIIANIGAPLFVLVTALFFPLSALLAEEPDLAATLCLSSVPYLLGVGVIYWTKRWVETHSD